MNTFNEGTALTVQADFLTDGLSTSPASIHYRLRNVTEDVTVIDWTEVAIAQSVTIAVDGRLVRIEDQRNSRERQELTLVANKDTATQVPERIYWDVMNLDAIDG